jgi:hypothetical protein
MVDSANHVSLRRARHNGEPCSWLGFRVDRDLDLERRAVVGDELYGGTGAAPECYSRSWAVVCRGCRGVLSSSRELTPSRATVRAAAEIE